MIYSAKIDSDPNCIGATTIEMAKTNNLTVKGPFSCLDDPGAINLRVRPQCLAQGKIPSSAVGGLPVFFS